MRLPPCLKMYLGQHLMLTTLGNDLENKAVYVGLFSLLHLPSDQSAKPIAGVSVSVCLRVYVCLRMCLFACVFGIPSRVRAIHDTSDRASCRASHRAILCVWLRPRALNCTCTHVSGLGLVIGVFQSSSSIEVFSVSPTEWVSDAPHQGLLLHVFFLGASAQ